MTIPDDVRAAMRQALEFFADDYWMTGDRYDHFEAALAWLDAQPDAPEPERRKLMHIEMNSIWRWLYNVAGRDFGGTPAAPNDGVRSPEFASRQHGMSTGVEWFSASFSNDAADFWIACKWTDEETSKWYSVMAAEDFRKIALWYLWRWAWGEWFGLRRWLWYATLRRRPEVTP